MNKQEGNSLKRKQEMPNLEKRIKIVAEDLPSHINFWLNEATPDCYFKVGPERGPVEKIGALKVFLAAHSEPLAAMFGDSYEEREKGEARIVDVEAETFKNLLKCICGGGDVVIPKLTFEESAKLLQLADKYLVDYVKHEVVGHVTELLTIQNLFTALSYPACLQDKNVSTKILNILIHDAVSILTDERFLDLSGEAVLWLLQQQKLNAKEVDIWNAVLKWGKNKVNSSDGRVIRSSIAPFLTYIRFLTMDLEELWSHVVPANVLLMEEVHELCVSRCAGTPHNIKHICTAIRPRQLNIPSKNITIIPITGSMSADVYCSIHCKNLKRKEDSESFSWAGYQWNISAGRTSLNGWESFGLSISCFGAVESYSCQIEAFVTLVSAKELRFSPGITRAFYGTFSEKTMLIGNSSFCSWETMTRTCVRNNKVTVIFHIQLF